MKEILAWPPASSGSGCELSALISYLTQQVNKPLSEPEVRSVLTWLSDRGLVHIDGDALRLIKQMTEKFNYKPDRTFSILSILRVLVA